MEIEIKARIKNLATLRKKLIQVGAKKIGDKHQIDTYLSPAHKSFFKTRYYLRVRQDLLNKNKDSFDYHILKLDGKLGASEELEVGVQNGKKLLNILKALDFKKLCLIEKKREVFKFKDFEIVLDQVKKLGNFIEVELDEKLKNHKSAYAKIGRFLKKLGVSKKQYCEFGGYVELMLGTVGQVKLK